MGIVALVLVWILGSIINGQIAKEKGRDVLSAVSFSVLISPFLIYAYLLAVPPLPRSTED